MATFWVRGDDDDQRAAFEQAMEDAELGIAMVESSTVAWYWDESRGWTGAGMYEWWGDVEELKRMWRTVRGGELDGNPGVDGEDDVWFEALELQSGNREE